MSSDINKKMADETEIGMLASNLRVLMNKMNVDSAELSKKTGIALTTINGLKRGSGNPTLSTLQELAEFFDVTIGELAEKNLSKSRQLVYEIPLLVQEELPEYLKNPRKFKQTISTELDVWKQNKYYAIRITNNAMQPLFEKGSIFVIVKDANIHDGDIVLVQFDQHPPCFRKVFIEGKSYFFKSVSELINGNIIKHDSFHIHGIVIKAIQHFNG